MYPKPKKSLGQNFLIDKNIQKKILNASNFRPPDTVLEIGSGTGELTRLLAEKVNCVYALEIDERLCNILKDNLKGYKNVILINNDILKFDLKKYFKKIKKKIQVIGNIPYYITTPIIEHLLKYRGIIDGIYISVQKEFAQRMSACPGTKEYGSFSCFIQYYTEPKTLFIIKKRSFYPSPKVDSCFLYLNIREAPLVETKDEKLLFKIIRGAFNQRRKTLRNSLKGIIPQEKLDNFFNKYIIDPNIRPEELALEDFANLANIS